MRSFRSLSARLTVQFALLFAVAMLAVSAALYTFIAGSASREVESQLQSSGAVYDRLWQQRAHELQNAAQLLSRDFGFRAAVATGDEATMRSALGNAAGGFGVFGVCGGAGRCGAAYRGLSQPFSPEKAASAQLSCAFSYLFNSIFRTAQSRAWTHPCSTPPG